MSNSSRENACNRVTSQSTLYKTNPRFCEIDNLNKPAQVQSASGINYPFKNYNRSEKKSHNSESPDGENSFDESRVINDGIKNILGTDQEKVDIRDYRTQQSHLSPNCKQMTKLIKRDTTDCPLKDGNRGIKRASTGNLNVNRSQQSDSCKFQPQSNAPPPAQGVGRGKSKFTELNDPCFLMSASVMSKDDKTIRPAKCAPSRRQVETTQDSFMLNSVQPPGAYCSVEEDLPDKPM